MNAVTDIANVLADLRRLNDGDPDALAERDRILSTKQDLIRRLQRNDPRPRPAGVPLICARPGCTNLVNRGPRLNGGRPAIYCSPACRPSRNRQPRVDQLSIDIEQDDETGDGVHPGRSWTVTLRRGHHTVIVGHDLGRFAATALAAELHQLIYPRTRQEGDPID